MQPKPVNAGAFATISVTWHAIVWVFLFSAFYFLVPWAKKAFQDFGVELPGATIIVMEISDWIVNYFYFLPFLVAPMLAVDWIVLFALRQNPGTRLLSRLFNVLMLAVPFSIALLCGLAFLVPLSRLIRELGG